MSAVRRGRAASLGFALSVSLLIAGSHAAKADASGEGDELAVFLDQATLVKLPERATTVVIGNPLIADVSLQPGGLMVLTGKGHGMTNVIALDRTGATLMERQVVVRGPYADTVVVYRGVRRETYSCTPFCEPRVTLGDDPNYFRQHLSTTTSWNAQVFGAAQRSRR